MNNTLEVINNVAIIGGGPAGLSAALYAARANMNPIVFAGSPPGGQLMLTTENFPGTEHIMGPQLVESLRTQAEKFGTKILNENVLKVDFSAKPFVLTYGSTALKAHTIIIATGAQALWLGLESEQKLRGKGVSACATCDGFFFRNKDVAVVGGGDTAMEEAQTLTRFANKVYMIHRRDSFRASKIMQERILNNPKIEVIWNNEIQEVLGNMKVEGLKLKNNYQSKDILSVDGLFLAIGHKPDTDLFKDQIELDEKGYVVTSIMKALSIVSQNKDHNKDRYHYDFQTMTSIPGIFAAGDCVDHVYKQAGTAAGMGIAAALDMERWLLEKGAVATI
ncbi:MAG TPA: thioredoxin-disulfide reductase [Candidatus Woesebacteria bacterium]|nr:thioredoxin-disulfide reductase [Candidatus Woesebacteria bacterium]